MKPAALMVCKGLIPANKQDLYLSFLPRDTQVLFTQLPESCSFEKKNLKWDLLDHIHYSWLAPYLRTLSSQEIRLCMAALTSVQQHGLEKALGYENNLPPLPHLTKKALRSSLYGLVTDHVDLLPYSFLPEHSLNLLLDLSTDRLAKVIRYLGLHDLAYEMKQIIATKELKRIFSHLTEKEGEFLNSLLLHQQPLIFKRLFLSTWKGTKEDLHKLLDERGSHRLGHLLYGASDSLIWYITHALDIHVGTHVLKSIEKPTHERAKTILLGQIHHILTYLEPKEQE